MIRSSRRGGTRFKTKSRQVFFNTQRLNGSIISTARLERYFWFYVPSYFTRPRTCFSFACDIYTTCPRSHRMNFLPAFRTTKPKPIIYFIYHLAFLSSSSTQLLFLSMHLCCDHATHCALLYTMISNSTSNTHIEDNPQQGIYDVQLLPEHFSRTSQISDTYTRLDALHVLQYASTWYRYSKTQNHLWWFPTDSNRARAVMSRLFSPSELWNHVAP